MTLFSPVGSLNYASHTPSQENDLEKKMTATSGRKCLDVFEKFNRNGLWAKTYSALLIGQGGLVFDEVQSDLEAEGYEVQAYVLPACAVNAPHRRDRVWFVAHATDSASDRRQRARKGFEVKEGLQPRPGTTGELERGFEGLCGKGDAADTENSGQQTRPERPREKQFRRRDEPMGPRQWDRFPTQSPVCRRDDGLSSRLDGITFSKWRNESIKAYGNAVVPQVVYEIFKAIQEYEKL